MPAYTENGLTIGWTAPAHATSEGARLVLTAQPPHPSNVVRVVYSLGVGPERVARGFPLDAGPSGDPQRFAVDLPSPPPGERLRWRPLLACSGREADPRRGGLPPETLDRAPDIAAEAPPATRPAAPFPTPLEFLARVTAPLERHPRVVGETPEGLRIFYPLAAHGTVRGPKLNGEILHDGGDWMVVRRDGIGVPDVRVLIRTDRGEMIFGAYSGVVDFGADGHDALLAGRPPKRAYTQLAPRYETSAPSLAWLNRLQCAAFGWVTMETLLVEYDLYALRSGAADAP